MRAKAVIKIFFKLNNVVRRGDAVEDGLWRISELLASSSSESSPNIWGNFCVLEVELPFFPALDSREICAFCVSTQIKTNTILIF